MHCSTFRNIALAIFLSTPFTSGSVLHHGRGDVRDMHRRSETSKSTQISITQIAPTTSLLSVTHDAEETPITGLSTTPSATKPHSSSSMTVSQSTAVISIPDPVATSDTTPTTGPDPNGLPFTPLVTPGLAVGGVVLLLAGIPYLLLGVRYKKLQIFFSIAFLSSLGVTVLVVYVMNPPVSNAIQGGYITAVVITGLFMGGLAVVFPEVTEAFGCLLGGFCVAMWFLVLQPGGLITSVYGKIIMILAFCISIFSLAFFHKTRPYALIFSVAFSGATAIILGLDCFSRAGLKEFWLYIWDLNDNIFPLYTTTFPITRGMRVEVAMIIILTIIGVISQLKLWRVIKEKRNQREAQRLREEEEANAMEIENGRRLEAETQKERAQWEAQYGDKPPNNSDSDSCLNDKASTLKTRRSGLSNDSGLGPEENQKAQEVIQMVELEPVAEDGQQAGSPVQDGSHRQSQKLVAPAVVIVSKSSQNDHIMSTDNSGMAPPEAVHTVVVDTEKEDDDDASSLATFADSVRGKLRTADGTQVGTQHEIEHFDAPQPDDDVSSVAATHDMEDRDNSDDESPLVYNDNDKRMSVLSVGKGRKASIIASVKRASMVSISRRSSQGSITKEASGVSRTNSLKTLERALTRNSVKEQTTPSLTIDTSKAISAPLPDSPALPSPSAKSHSGSVSGSPRSPHMPVRPTPLRRESLRTVAPPPSRIVKTYRTSEWAKHLEDAERPELENLEILQEMDVNSSHESHEVPAPVHVYDLQEGASSSYVPTPALTRSVSRVTLQPPSPTSHQDPNSRMVSPAPSIMQSARSSSNPIAAHYVMESPLEDKEMTQFRDAAPSSVMPYQTETLMGKREMLLKATPSFSSLHNQLSVTGNQALQSTSHLSQAPVIQYLTKGAQGNPLPPLHRSSSAPTAPQPDNISVRSFNLPSLHEEEITLSQRRAELRAQGYVASPTLAAPLIHSPGVTRSPTLPNRAFSPIPGTHVAQIPQNNQWSDPHRRENMLAQWRDSIRNDETIGLQKNNSVQDRRANMMQERQMQAQAERHREMQNQYKESLFDERMRQGDMIALHREAMRKMQNGANV